MFIAGRWAVSYAKRRTLIIVIILAGCGLYLAIWGTDLALTRDSADYLEYAAQALGNGIPPLQWRTPGLPLFLLAANSYPVPACPFVIVSVLLFGVAVYLQTRILAGIGLKDKYVVLFTGLTIIAEMVTRPSNQYLGIFYALALLAIVWFTPGWKQRWKSFAGKALVLVLLRCFISGRYRRTIIHRPAFSR